MQLITRLALFSALFLSGVSSAQNFNFYQEANLVISSIDQKLQACGLQIVDPYTPGLPYPQVPADRAIVTAQGQLLVYFSYEHDVFGDVLVYKNPYGGMRHSAQFSVTDLKYVTPLAGTIAHANRFRSVDGYHYNFYCHSVPVMGLEPFRECVTADFINVVTDQLCAYGSR